MDIRVCDSDQEVAEVAAGIVEKTIRSKPGSAVLPASGNTPVPLYRLLGERKLPSSALRVFQLDEYVGVDGDDPRSLFGWLQRVLLEPLDIPEAGVTRLRGDAGDLAAECANYDRAVETAGGIDLAILGLGLDGHLGYNEPPSPADAPTRVVTLRPESRAAAAQYWPPGTRVPDEGITAGMDVILHARCILLLVTGSEKRYILRRVLEGPVTPEVPASYLRTVDGAIVIADRKALEKG